MASMITNALVATETDLTNGGLYQHIFQEEIFFFIHQMEYKHLLHLSNHFMNVHATNMVSTNCYTICIGRNVQVVLWEVTIRRLY